MTELLRATEISFAYGSRQVIESIDASVNAGEIVSVIGPNGSGKSTLLRCLIGLQPPRSGLIHLLNRDLTTFSPRERARVIGYVPQASHEEQPFTVADAILMGRRPHAGWRASNRDIEVTERVMTRLGIAHLAQRYLGELSGGQKQKVLIARALAQEPRLLALDEPISALDIYHQLEVLEQLRGLAREQRTGVLMVLHDLSLAHRFSDRVLLMNEGQLQAVGTPESVITTDHVASVYHVDIELHATRQGHLVQPLRRCAHEVEEQK
ncbi:MAG: ABC transporter ATP-binding protein [Leucobacter sp.]|jgi:iron complex transport system ATP-binding protein|nr:ABC transporter ATP-binding protein [Leucobacter sp.]